MRSGRTSLQPLAALVALVLTSATTATAQPDLAGKSVHMIIGFGPGGGYDLWGRTIGRHIGRHLPGNPNVIPQNMPGAGSYAAASYLFNVAPKDGTVLGIIARDAALGPLSGAAGARFDPLRLSWIGTPTKETNVCIAYHTAQVKTVQDLSQKELILGDTGPGTGTRSYPKVLNELLGLKFKLVGGFKSSVEVFLAMGAARSRASARASTASRTGAPTGSRRRRSRSCSRAVPSPIPSSRASPLCSISHTPPSKSRRSNSSMPGRASGVHSSRRPTCRRIASRCCATPSTRP